MTQAPAPRDPAAPRRGGDAPGAGSVDPRDHPPLALADADWGWFAGRCRVLGLGDPAPWRPVLEALHGHLVGVNRWLNLTRIADGREWLSRHVLDSLTARALPWWGELTATTRCADLGSGGGYPGLPLAVSGPARWTLIDSRERKVRFLAAAGGIIDAQRVNARAVRGAEVAHRATDLAGAFQVVTTRATAGPDEILPEAAPLLARGGRLVVWQGPSHDDAAQKRAETVAKRLAFVPDTGLRVQLEDGLGERVLVVFRRT